MKSLAGFPATPPLVGVIQWEYCLYSVIACQVERLEVLVSGLGRSLPQTEGSVTSTLTVACGCVLLAA